MQAGRSAEISVVHGPQSHALAVVAPRSSSLPMGSSISKPTEPSVAAKVRRAFAGRRRKEKDNDSRSLAGSFGIARQAVALEVSPSSASSPAQVLSPPKFITNHPKQPSQLSSISSVSSTPKKAPPANDPRPLPPPPPPPKSATEFVSGATSSVTTRPQPPAPVVPPNRSSIMPVTPGMESALTFLAISDQQRQQPTEAQPSLPSRPANSSSGPVQSTYSASDGHSQTEKQMIQGNPRAQEPERTPLQPDVEEPRRIERPRARSESESALLEREYADKRKSDSTISHCTIRPGAGGPRSSRPVSMAESFQSTYTIVPGNGATSSGVVMVNKRLSAVDVDLAMLEEDDDSFRSFDDSEDQRGSMVIVRAEEKVSSPLLKPKRRSMSLNVGIGGSNSSSNGHTHLTPPNASAAELKQPSHSISEGFYNHPTSTSSSLATSHSNHPQTWTPNRMLPNRNLPPVPPDVNASFTYPTQRPLPSHPPPPPSFRQTAVSISSSFAPAAGLARKAVEKVRGALGHMGHHGSSNSGSISSASISSVSGYSSSASVSSVAPSSLPNEFGVLNLSRSPSTRSSATHHTHNSSMHAVNIKEIKERNERERLQQVPTSKKEKKMRRTPNGPSGTHSIGSGSTKSGSDSDAFMFTGPVLGVLLRGPLRNRNGAPATSGVVFQRDLARCVRDTAVWVGKEEADMGRETGGRELMGRPELKVYERRMLPALVVRCAQHLLLWGVQEEGLFRVPGRAAHITKLRTEFDTGVDYDMSGCAPGDLDPHAVASTFKAYLRELPESILTQKLSPYFDAAIEQESSSASAADPHVSQLGLRKGIGLPSSQKPTSHYNPPPSALPSMSSTSSAFPVPNLRKPPSLSTFAVPSLGGTRPASHHLIMALRSLIAQMPKENRDLLRTVVELVRATAKESKLTKMPLSNLLMVFLPSLSISAQLFRVLCEEEGVWSGLVDVSETDRDAEPESEGTKLDENEVLDVRRDTVVLDIRRNSDDQQTQKDDRETSANNAEDDDECEDDDVNAHRRWTVVNRPEIPTVYLDSRSQASSASIASSALVSSSREASTTESSVLHDDLSSASVSTRSARGEETEGTLSSSAESVLTPLTSSAQSSAAYLPLDALDTVKDLSNRDAAHVTGAGPKIQVVGPVPSGLEIGVEREEGQVRRFAVSSPLPYASTPAPSPSNATASSFDKNMPESPASPTSSKRRSIPTLSFPSLSSFGHRNSNSSAGSEPVSPAGSSSSGKGQVSGSIGLRTKKPSLKLMFKKSAGSLNNGPKGIIAVNGSSSAPGSAPGSGGLHSFVSQQLKTASMILASGSVGGGDGSCSSDSSVSTPVSAVTAPGTAMSNSLRTSTSVLELPPALDASFEEGPSLRKQLGLEESPPGTAKPAQPQQKEKIERVKTMIGQTPIADWYSLKSAASSVSDLQSVNRQHAVEEGSSYEEDYDVEARRRTVIGRIRGSAISSQVSLNHLGMDDDDLAEEDWTSSVLLAADVEFGLGRP